MKCKKTYKSIAIALSAPLVLNGCASTSGTSNTAIGCIGGAVIGAFGTLLVTGDAKKALIGGGIGLIAGCGAGYYLDEREKALAKLAEDNSLMPEFERISNDTNGTAFSSDATENIIASQVSLSTEKPMFESGKSVVTDPKQIANLRAFLKGYVHSLDSASKIYVVGHTDSSGSAAFNQRLSEKRAKFIADELVKVGANPERLFFEGVGESQPAASNLTNEGKRKNRRFELVDVLMDKKEKTNNENTVSDEQVIQVASAKKTRIENVINDLPIVEKENKSLPKPTVSVSKRNLTSSLGLQGVKLSEFDKSYVMTALGKIESESSMTFFSAAHASDSQFIGSCAYSVPVVRSSIKPYTGRPIQKAKIADSISNLYGTAWYGMAGSTAVTLGPIGIEKNTLNPTHKPYVSFYKQYDGSATKADFKYPVNVETYRGDGTILVRMFAKDSSALMRCSDVVFSTNGARQTQASAVIYQENNELMAKAFKMTLVKG